ncbi:MAG: VOC family protein [Nocardioidaceae bacterium]|nr:VOC family protein [Nocardioidaceae bacterium]
MGPLLQVTFDCADPAAQAAFWAAAIGYQEQTPPDGFESWDQLLEQMGVPEEERDSRAAVIDPEGIRPRLFFQRVPEGKTAKNRMHLDIHVAVGLQGDERRRTIEAESARLTGLGATVLRRVEPEMLSEFCIVMADPEGNEFCVD